MCQRYSAAPAPVPPRPINLCQRRATTCARSHTSSSRPHCSSASAASFMTVFAPLPSDCVDNTRTPTTMQHKPGVRRAPAIHETPRQSHLQRNAQFLDDIFVGDVPRLRSTAGRNVKTAAHLYPVRGASYSSLPRENCDLGRPRTSLALFFAFNDFVADPTRRPFILPFDAARRGPPADDPLDDPPRGE